MTGDMRILAWDTATGTTSAAIVKVSADGTYTALAEFEREGGPGHSQILPPQIAALLKATRLAPRDLSLVAVGRGPGSFTGLRTGLSLAKGLALGAGLPLMGLSTLEVMAAQMIFGGGAALAAPLIDARHREIFAALYRPVPGQERDLEMECLAEPRPLAPEAFAALLEKAPGGGPISAAGSGLASLAAVPPRAAVMPPPDNIAVMLARLAARRLFKDGEAAFAANPALPMYIRQPDIRKSGIVL